MRHSNGRQLARYLMVGWVLGVLTLTATLYITHGSLDHGDWVVVISTSCITGGIFWHIVDVWKFEETYQKRNRKHHDITPVKH